MQKAYSSDLTDAEWQVIKPVFADQRSYAQHSPRQIMNALFYLLKTGCQWRMLPKGFPPWKTVYTHFRKWRESGRIQRLHARLRRAVRLMARRHPGPSAAVIDAQSVPTARQGGPERGLSGGGKNVKGRKRHVVARAMGLVLAVVVGSANESEGQKAPHVFQKLLGKVPRLEVVFADKGYEGTPSGLARALLRMAAEHCATRRRWFLQRVRADPETMGRRAHLRLVCKLAAAGAPGLRVSPRKQRSDDPDRYVTADGLPAQVASQDRL